MDTGEGGGHECQGRSAPCGVRTTRKEKREGETCQTVARSEKADADVVTSSDGERARAVVSFFLPRACGGRRCPRSYRGPMPSTTSPPGTQRECCACCARWVKFVAVGLASAAVAPHFTPFEASRGLSRSAQALNRCNFSADIDCQRRDRSNVKSTAPQGRKREREKNAKRTCASKAVNTRVFIAWLL